MLGPVTNEFCASSESSLVRANGGIYAKGCTNTYPMIIIIVQSSFQRSRITLIPGPHLPVEQPNGERGNSGSVAPFAKKGAGTDWGCERSVVADRCF